MIPLTSLRSTPADDRDRTNDAPDSGAGGSRTRQVALLALVAVAVIAARRLHSS